MHAPQHDGTVRFRRLVRWMGAIGGAAACAAFVIAAAPHWPTASPPVRPASAHRSAGAAPGPARPLTLRTPPAGPAPWLAPARGPGHLAPGSNPSALPADVLVADHQNNRLLIIDPRGRVRWRFPRPGDLARGQTFRAPDDAFFSP